MELIELVNFLIIFLSQTILVRLLTFLFRSQTPDCDPQSPSLLDLFISSDSSICSTMMFLALGNSDHVVVAVSIDLSSNAQWDALFHFIA